MDQTYSHSNFKSGGLYNETGKMVDIRNSMKIVNQQRELAAQVADFIKAIDGKDNGVLGALRKSLNHIQNAANQLNRQSFKKALDEQDKAIAALIAAAERMTDNLDSVFREDPVTIFSKKPRLSRRTYRLNSQNFLELKTIKMPIASEIRKTREIIKKIRRRKSQFNRPNIELKYLERLLGQF